MDSQQVRTRINEMWDKSIVPALEEYIRIPNVSPSFEADWASKPHTDNAVKLMTKWVEEQKVNGLKMEVIKEGDRTPLIFIEIDGSNGTQETTMMYGHLDKQPPFEGWNKEEGLEPYKPVIKDGVKLYGRGGADDGYAIFASIASIKVLQELNVPHSRVVVIIESCEESGSEDLPFYIEKLKERIGSPSLIICLDSGCGNYEQLWITTSLRGMVRAPLRVDILTEGVHSGHASGIVPSSFRILRHLITRLEDPKNGKVDNSFHVTIPKIFRDQAKEAAKFLKSEIVDEFPFVEGASGVSKDFAELLLNRSWRPQLSVTGADGFPNMAQAGNVLRPFSSVMLSLRLPPTLPPKDAADNLKKIMEKNPPYGAKVSCTPDKFAPGWAAPEMDEWLKTAVNDASNTFFGHPAAYMGEGGSIPFMGMLGEMFPKAQFVITGVLGPKSNAHGPNEFLHIPMGKNITCCISSVLNDHYKTKCTEESAKKAKTE